MRKKLKDEEKVAEEEKKKSKYLVYVGKIFFVCYIQWH